jgi:dihydrofolate synthase/folylpolyglutamate synthase
MATIRRFTKIICDTAHNKEGLSIVLRQIKKKLEKLHIVLGVVNDKDLNQILPLFLKRHLLFLQAQHSSA